MSALVEEYKMNNLFFTMLGSLFLLTIGCGGVEPEPAAERLKVASMAISERALPGCEIPNLALATTQLEILQHPLDPVLQVLQHRGDAICIDTPEAITRYINVLAIISPPKHATSYISDPVEDDPHPLTREPRGDSQTVAPEDDPHPLTNSTHPAANQNPEQDSAPEDDPHPLTRRTSRPSSSDNDEIIYNRPYVGIR